MSIEPVNTMGVVAFPNPDKDKRAIRFIDSGYNELFKLLDGNSIVITSFNGSKTTLTCTYIDDYHAKIGSNVYHICEFAEIMNENGATYAPEHPQQSDICDTYEIFQIKSVRETGYCFRSDDEAKDLINPADYQRVYAGVLAEKVTLEDLWRKHNRDSRPFGQEMHSMSMSDIVVLNRGGEKKAYYVDDFGFEETDRFLPKERNTPKKARGDVR